MALAYLLSWAWEIPLVATGRTVTSGHGWPTHLPSLLGPMLAALLVTWQQTGSGAVKALLARMFRWRLGWWWIAAASPLPVCLVAALLLAATGAATPVGDFASYNGVPASLGLVAVWLLVLLVNGLGEEVGWRGFALPRLEAAYGALPGTALLALAWAGWHLPQFFLLDSFRRFSVMMIPIWLYGLFSGAVVMTWLYNRTGGSVLAVAVFHGLYNLTGATQAASDHSGALGVIMWAFVVVLAIGLMRAERRASAAGGPTVIGTRR